MFRFFLLDDDSKFLNYAKERIISYSIKKNIDIDIVSFNYIPEGITYDYDAFFLDVEIHNNSSFSLLATIKKSNPDIPVIVFSNHSYYINQSVKYYIFDFIRKIQFDNEINETLDRLFYYIQKNNDKIIININHVLTKIYIKDIQYIEAYSHNCIIHTKNKEYNVSKGINKILEDKLSAFVKIHKSYYVNISLATSFSAEQIVLEETIKLPIGKKYRLQVKKAFFTFQ